MASRISRTPAPSEPVGQIAKLGHVRQKKAGIRYVLVPRNDVDTIDKYRALRYRPVRWEFEKDGKNAKKDEFGEKIALNAFVGRPQETDDEGGIVSFRGNVLMEISDVLYRQLVAEGAPEADGSGGQVGADEMDRRIIRNQGLLDASRNLRGTSIRAAMRDGIRHGAQEAG